MAGVDSSGKQSTTRERMRVAVALVIAGINRRNGEAMLLYGLKTGEYALVTEFGKAGAGHHGSRNWFQVPVSKRSDIRQPAISRIRRRPRNS